MMNATERLAEHVLMARYEDLSPLARNAAKIFILDTLGVTLAGTRAPYAAELRTAVSAWGQGEETSVLGLGLRLPAANAALLNGFQAHCQEFDCVHEPAVVHPLASIQSGLLAWCERQGGIAGRDFLLALCLGVDVAASIGMAAQSGLRFFRPATAGIFGVTAAIAKLAGLDRKVLLDAFGLALAQVSGTMQAHIEGTPALALGVGMAARNGIQAVDLAAAGMSGPHDVLEGRYGYFPLIEGQWDLTPVLAELGQVWRITQVSHKPFPCGRANHGGIDGIQRLLADGLSVEQVERLELHAPPLIHQLVGRPIKPDMAVNYARLCFQYTGALTLQNGTVDLADFEAERLRDESLHRLAERITVIIDNNPDPNALIPQRIVARLRSGARREVNVEQTLGSPANPLEYSMHLDKFRRCWNYGAEALPASHREPLIERVEQLETLPCMVDLLSLLRM